MSPTFPKISVSRRLAFLVAVQAATIILLIVLGLVSLSEQRSHIGFMKQFALVPAVEIGDALQSTTRLQLAGEALHAQVTEGRLRSARDLDEHLRDFVKSYTSEWQVEGSAVPSAQDFRRRVAADGNQGVLREELDSAQQVAKEVEALSAAVFGPGGRPGDLSQVEARADALRRALRRLKTANIELAVASQNLMAESIRRAIRGLIALGLLSAAISVLLGLRVRRAIAPRLKRLVTSVERFRQYGKHERQSDPGADEITVLSNAIDTGFQAIQTREAERERFLAIAAHELKTPLTSIIGFTQAALEQVDDGPLRRQALEVIRRNANRLSRLSEDLLWAASARAGSLPFHPGPIDLVSLVRNVRSEVEATLGQTRFDLNDPGEAHALADEALLAHGLWSLLNFAAAVSVPPAQVAIDLFRQAPRWKLDVHLPMSATGTEDLERAFQPFSTVQFEGMHGIRNAVGLYLCREVARLHGGRLGIHEEPNSGCKLTLELPA